MNARPKLVVGNWKLHGSLSTNAALLEQIKAAGKTNATLAVCVPFPYLAQCQSLLAGSAVGWGAQDVSAETRGAFTGEVAASMLSEFGCGYAIVGHSEAKERRLEREVRLPCSKCETILPTFTVSWARGVGGTAVKVVVCPNCASAAPPPHVMPTRLRRRRCA